MTAIKLEWTLDNEIFISYNANKYFDCDTNYL